MNVHVPPAYAVDKLEAAEGVSVLRAIFPDGEADDLNFVLFSTSGTHGTYLSIEEVAESLGTDAPDRLTVLVVQPRTVRMLYGHIDVQAEDIEFLMKLRASSARVLSDYQ